MKIGIDLGSSSTLAAFVGVEGDPILIPDAADQHQQSTPSRVLLQGDRALIGYHAERLGHESSGATMVSNFKRYFGTNQILAKAGKDPLYSEAIAALLLKKIKYDAEVYTSSALQSCVITVPAHFHDQQRRSILAAADIAGIQISALLDEPIAAALHYAKNKIPQNDETIIIYDLGGGTFDLSILTYVDGQVHILAKSGLTNLGGCDFDKIVESRFYSDFREIYKSGIKENSANQIRVNNLCEQIKVSLNDHVGAWPDEDIYIDGKFLKWQIDPQYYSKNARALLRKTESLVLKTLRGIGMEMSDISKFILVGGASRGELVRNFWNERLDTTKQILSDHQPMASVAKGAALYADTFEEDTVGANFVSSIKLSSVTAFNVGVRDELSQVFQKIIEKNTPLPTGGSAIIRLRGGFQEDFGVQICQYLDSPENLDVIGNLSVKSSNLRGRDMIEIVIKNNNDGTLGIKATDPQTGSIVPFAYRDNSDNSRDVEAQRRVVSRFRVNILEL